MQPSTQDSVLLECSNEIAWLTLNRPQALNAFDEHLIANLLHKLQEVKRQPKLRVLILKAKGRYYSAGADLKWMQKMVDYEYVQNRQEAMQMAMMMAELYHLPIPTIALVQGPAYGGGIGLIACCDVAIASDNTHFCFSEVKLGLAPAVISPYVIAAMGKRVTQRYFLTAERFSADEALQFGLIHRVVKPENLQAAADDLVNQLLQNSPNALKHTKAMLRNTPDNDQLVDLIATLRVSDEGQRGLQALLRKQAPDWKSYDKNS